ncbi:MAG: type II toxin-antitoxin system YafQ family toxin [Campylobacteraceae bacterium]|jgi:mRNA interferase YafQ|nr:type II toxin-antitoxin system YafQ family toxin [Campylobacteraceae bacterium]
MKYADYTIEFGKCLKAAKKKRRNTEQLEMIIDMLLNEKELPKKYHDHALSGDMQGMRVCHITNNPDFLLLYELFEELIILHACGSHDEFFK